MTKVRVAAGAGAAILVVGAVVHLKPTSRLTAESFVSAVYTNTPGVGITGSADEIANLPACAVQSLSLSNAAAVAVSVQNTANVGTAKLYDTDYCSGGGATVFYVTDKACVCGKFALTKGRICEASGNANPKGQSYLPRCPAKGTNIPTSYTSGCWCGADEDFTSANTDMAVGSDVKLAAAALATTNVATEPAICIADTVCLKGETCTAGTPNYCTADGGTTKITRRVQKYAWMLPKIAPNALDEKFAICKSTAMQAQQCDATTATAQTANKPMCKDV